MNIFYDFRLTFPQHHQNQLLGSMKKCPFRAPENQTLLETLKISLTYFWIPIIDVIIVSIAKSSYRSPLKIGNC